MRRRSDDRSSGSAKKSKRPKIEAKKSPKRDLAAHDSDESYERYDDIFTQPSKLPLKTVFEYNPSQMYELLLSHGISIFICDFFLSNFLVQPDRFVSCIN